MVIVTGDVSDQEGMRMSRVPTLETTSGHDFMRHHIPDTNFMQPQHCNPLSPPSEFHWGMAISVNNL
jgi:hypothetical protein